MSTAQPICAGCIGVNALACMIQLTAAGQSMNAQDMEVIGILRFSYPALGGFQILHDTVQDRRDFLYAPARMEERFRTFEALTLPGLKAQTDPNFKLLIVIGDCLPDEYQDRLFALLEDFPQAIVVPWPAQKHRPAMREIMNHYRNPEATLPCIQFRHDDDDALAVNYVETLRQTVNDCAALIADKPLFGIDFSNGYSVRLTPNGLEAAHTVLPYYGVALAMTVAPGFRQSIMNFAHHKLMKHMPTVSLNNPPMFLRSHGAYNDSHVGTPPDHLDFKLLNEKQERRFKRRFAIDSDYIRSLF